jgi:uncharacterized integral membrane protein
MSQSREAKTPSVEVEEPSRAARVKMGAGVVATLALLLFFAQNLQEVQMHFLWFDWNTRLLFALFASTAIGALATWLFGTLRRRRAHHSQK